MAPSAEEEAAAADPSTEEEEADPSPFDPSLHPSMAAPWIFSQAYRDDAIYAIDCTGKSSDPEPIPKRFDLPKDLLGYMLRGSIGHHLLLEKQGSLSGMRLFDPFSSAIHVVPLPPSATLMHPPPPTSGIRPEECRHRYQIHTLVADTYRDIAVALLQLSDCRLAYTKIQRNNPGNSDPGWVNLTHLITDGHYAPHYISFGSAVLWNRGLFCLVDLTGTLVFSLDLSSSPVPKLSPITYNLPDNYSPTYTYEDVDWCCYQSASLVSSCSSLFLVRWRTIFNRDKDGVKKRRDIDIHRLDHGTKEWVAVNSLGDHSFFIDHTCHSISISAADFPDIRSNRIYLALDATTRISGNDYEFSYDDDDECELGHHLVYDLGDGRWSVFYAGGFYAFPPHSSFWMIPRRGAAICLRMLRTNCHYLIGVLCSIHDHQDIVHAASIMLNHM